MIVTDASVILEILLRTENAAAIENRIFSAGELLVAPYLLDVEVVQVLRRYAFRGEISEIRGLQAITDLLDLPITRYPHDILVHRAWNFRNNMTAYDAMYFVLAESLDAVLLTRDKSLAAAATGKVEVELV